METPIPKERAAHIRSELKANFPNTKFSVKSSSYSMGSDVLVKWTDGPTEDKVISVIECLVEDMRHLYEINLQTKSQDISYSRNISKDTYELVKSEVIKRMEESGNPYITDYWAVEKKISHELNERNFS